MSTHIMEHPNAKSEECYICYLETKSETLANKIKALQGVFGIVDAEAFKKMGVDEETFKKFQFLLDPEFPEFALKDDGFCPPDEKPFEREP